MIQIISGEFKKRNILSQRKFLQANKIRPSTNFTKQQLISIMLNNKDILDFVNLKDSVVADFCCGTGSVGFEFLSNGAKKCHFVDINSDAIKFIKNTAEYIGILDKISTGFSLTHLKKINEHIDILFFDPPYDEQEKIIVNLISIALKSEYVNNKTLFIAELYKNQENLLKTIQCEIILTKKSLSNTHLIFFRLKK